LIDSDSKSDQDPDLWLFVSICLQTSMRHGEARRLRWEHFDAHRRRFFIPEAKAGEREQPIPIGLAATLCQVQMQRNAKEGFLFVAGPGSKTEHRHTFRKAFRRAAIGAELDPDVITPHVLRHTAITKLVKAGVDLPTVQRVSGHKTISMVLRYSHIDGAHIDTAVDHLRL
jgi:integrase